MAITALFRVPRMTAAQYDRIIADLEAAGLGEPEGRRYHVACPTDDGWMVLDVWDSEEAFGRFAGRLMPIAAAAGATPPPPETHPVHNVVVGKPLLTR